MPNARRRRFLAWYALNYPDDSTGRAKFMRDTERPGTPALTKGRVSQLFDEREPFGERAASSLAARIGLALDYFERDCGLPAKSRAQGIVEIFEQLPPVLQDKLYAMAEYFEGVAVATATLEQSAPAASAPNPSPVESL